MAEPDGVDVLRAQGWFATLPAEIQAELLAVGTVRAIARGAYLFEQGGEPTGLHGVLSGAVHIVGLSTDGNAVTISITRPGEWTGFLSCLDKLPYAYSATAREPTQVLSIGQGDVARIFERDLATYRLLLAPELVMRRKLGLFIIEGITLPLAQRVAARLRALGRAPYEPDSGPVSPLRNISQEELAMSVVATRPRINEILRDFAARGMIEIGYGKIEILDLAAVEQFARDG